MAQQVLLFLKSIGLGEPTDQLTLAKEVIFPKQEEFIFPIADGRIKTPGGDQDLRTSTLVRHRPVRKGMHAI